MAITHRAASFMYMVLLQEYFVEITAFHERLPKTCTTLPCAHAQ